MSPRSDTSEQFRPPLFRRKRSVSFLSVAPKRRLREIPTKRLSVSVLGVAAKRHFRGIPTKRRSVSIMGVAAKRQLRAIWTKWRCVVSPTFSCNSLRTTRLFGLSCTVRHAISKTNAGRSKFQRRVGTYNSCLEPAYLRSQLPSNSDFPISWSFALSLLLEFRSISNVIVYCSLKIKLTFLGISRKYFKDLFKKISSAAHGAKKIAL